MGIVLLWATCSHEYMAILVKKNYCIARQGILKELEAR